MWCQERDQNLSGFHKCLGSRWPMLCPERSKIPEGFHKCLGSKRPMLRPERDENLQGSHMCLGPQEARLCSALAQKAGRGGASPFCPQDSAHPPPLVVATLGQDDRSSIHINLRKTSFPNISSHSEGDRPRQKVGNDFCVFTFQRVLGFLHMAVHTTRRAIQKSRNTDLGNSLSTPWTYLGRGEAAVFSCMYYLEYVFFFF